MFRASSAHLQEDTVVYMQHMVLSQFVVACRYTAVHREATTNSHREWQYHMLHIYNCILLKMSTWGSKHVEENNILWINNNKCIKSVINIESNVNLSKTANKVVVFFYTMFSDFRNGVAFWEVPELGSVFPSGKRATCRWRKARSFDEMVFTGANEVL